MNFDWSDLAFGDKKPLRGLKATFIVAPREMSQQRLTQLVKEYLPTGNIVLGLSKEPYVLGLENQPQFRMLTPADAQKIVNKVAKSSSPHKMYTLSYFQRELTHIIEKISFKQAVLVNGSWHHAFHNLPAYYALVNTRTPYAMVSPFANEKEARTYAVQKLFEIVGGFRVDIEDLTEEDMMGLAHNVSKFSFDYNFQTGAALGRPRSSHKGTTYQFLGTSFNKVVPYQTYAMHHGASREQNFSPPHDLNHYDTVHAEVEMIIAAQKQQLDLKGTALFINLMPCPACARMFIETDIEEFVYSEDHSSGYAVKVLEAAGKKVRRLVVNETQKHVA